MLTHAELAPEYGAVKSYYNKATVITSIDDNGTTRYLESYATIVAVVDNMNNLYVTTDKGDLSNTTLRHIKEFALQFSYVDEDSLHKQNYVAGQFSGLDKFIKDFQ